MKKEDLKVIKTIVTKKNLPIIRRWIKALETKMVAGKRVTQTRNKLHNGGNGRCCLGVLCDLYALQHPEAKWKRGNANADFEFLDAGGNLPKEVADWIDDGEDPVLGCDEGGDTITAVQLNDGDSVDEIGRHSFAEIAAILRQHVQLYLKHRRK